MASIEIDTVCGDGETPEQAIETIAGLNPGVVGEVVNPHGPGGGNPIIKWSGDLDALEAMLRNAYEFDDATVDEWIIRPTTV